MSMRRFYFGTKAGGLLLILAETGQSAADALAQRMAAYRETCASLCVEPIIEPTGRVKL